MTGTILTLCLIGAGVLLFVLTLWGIFSRYRRAAPDELLVVFGKSGKMKVTGADGKETTIVTPSKIIQGGGTFVWPIIQDFKKMSMAPIQIKVTVDGIDSQAIPMHLPVVLTTAISSDKEIQQNAATRFLSASPTEIQKQVSEILVGETRAIMATMLIEEINAERDKFLIKVRGSLEQELAKVGYDVTNINISEITDDANYIKNLGQKAATKAQANAEADIAEQRKQGNVKIANTKKEEEIAVAQATKEQQVTVNTTKQEQEVKVAEIQRDKEIKLAEAEKERESGIADQEAEKAARIAEAKALAESKKAEAQAKQVANVSNAEADAESKRAEADARKVAAVAAKKAEAESSKAQSEAEQAKAVATAQADAEATENEQEAKKQTRIAQANQLKEAEVIKATQEKEAKAAEYESLKRQKKAEQDKKAGVAEQMSKIEVAQARAKAAQAEADAVKVGETAKVEADMSVKKTQQVRQLEVNEAEAKANEAKLKATEIVPAEKAKEKAIIEAEATKKKAELEAEALKAQILRKAEAEAEQIRLAKNAEAEGTRNVLMAEAEGKRALMMAEAEALQQKELAPAMAFERMIEAAGSPEMAVQWKMADHWEGISKAQAEALSRVTLGNVTIWGDKNTGGQFIKSLMENVTPVIDGVTTGIAPQLKKMLGSMGKKADTLAETPNDPNAPAGTGDDTELKDKPDKEGEEFEDVK